MATTPKRVLEGHGEERVSSVGLTSRVTSCLAMARSTASYICVFWMPRPQKMAKASRNCSSLRLKDFTRPDASSILLTSWQTPEERQGVGQVGRVSIRG